MRRYIEKIVLMLTFTSLFEEPSDARYFSAVVQHPQKPDARDDVELLLGFTLHVGGTQRGGYLAVTSLAASAMSRSSCENSSVANGKPS